MASTLTDLPAELIEAVLVLSAASDPSSIAALSQTSKFFHDLIYKCPDQHLWREIFLTTFDDPRPALDCLDTISGGHPNFDSCKFNWTNEYVRRISAAGYVRHPSLIFNDIFPPNPSGRMDLVQDLIDTPQLLSIVQTLLSVIETSAPFPSSPIISLTILTDPSSDEDAESPFAPMINSPPFPPLLLLLAANYNTTFTSLNAKWLDDLLEFGLPPELTRILFATLSIDVEGYPPIPPTLTSAAYWKDSEVSHLFHKLICCTGFMPILPPPFVGATLSPEPDLVAVDAPVPAPWSEVQSASSAISDPASIARARPQSSFYSAQEQFADARILARRRVYDMRYLSPARMWGPFRTVQRGDSDISTYSHRGQDEDADDDDDEYDEDEDDEDEDDLRLTYWINRKVKLNPPIAPHELVPDYVWLASARIVVEANLREVYERSEDPSAFSMGDILPLMRKMHTTRVGGSPGFWNGWVNRSGNMNEEGEESEGNVNGKNNESGEVMGWDWAGVNGIWKRCVCWLDYRELLIRNVSFHPPSESTKPDYLSHPQRAPESFIDDSIREACRLIPMTVRITGYSQAPIPPGSTARPLPTIHVEGESIGSDRSLHDVRKVKGTVSMIGDGAIRWSLVSSAPGSSEPEWSSEAVQIGGLGAAVGLLGMWTGALHERPDPLGPFWAWKVA